MSMKLWISLRKEKQSRITEYSILSLMVVIDLNLLQKDFLRLTLMNYSFQLSTMRQHTHL